MRSLVVLLRLALALLALPLDAVRGTRPVLTLFLAAHLVQVRLLAAVVDVREPALRVYAGKVALKKLVAARQRGRRCGGASGRRGRGGRHGELQEVRWGAMKERKERTVRYKRNHRLTNYDERFMFIIPNRNPR